MRLQWIQNQCKPDDKIVDIGCNAGHTFQGWTKRENVTHVDIDLYDLPNFVRADASKLPFKDQEFDVAVLAEILEHVPDPVKVLKEAARVAKKVVITVPNEHDWGMDAKPFRPIAQQVKESGKSREQLAKESNYHAKEFYTDDDYEHLWHVRFYTQKELEADLTKAGLSYELTNMKQDSFAWFCITTIWSSQTPQLASASSKTPKTGSTSQPQA